MKREGSAKQGRGRRAVVLGVALWLGGGAGFARGNAVEPASAHGTPVAKTNQVQSQESPGGTPAIASALRQTTQFIANSNLLSSAHDTEKRDPQDEYRTLLDIGRRQRVERSFTQARRNFIALLEGPASDDLKRAALLELGTLAQMDNQMGKAQQIYSQYLRRWPEDPSAPEIYLRQGLLYRQMGAPTLALSKFYTVMTSALTLKSGDMNYYQGLVLHAQTEIADTYLLDGRYDDAADFLRRLLKLETKTLDRVRIHFKLIRCLAAMNQHEETIAQTQDFLTRYADTTEEPEVRFLLAKSLKRFGQNGEALRQVLALLRFSQAATNRHHWIYWQQRTGNDIANQMYEEGDYLNALQIYGALAALDPAPVWQLPAWYQMGLVYERLQQPAKATEMYTQIAGREKELDSRVAPAVRTVLDMAKWRMEFLGWQANAERSILTNAQFLAPSLSPAAP